MSMRLSTLFYVAALFLSLISSSFSQSEQLWVPAGNPGEERTFFKSDTRQLNSSDLKVGDVVRADRSIWIRPAAADWANKSGPIQENSRVRIKSLQWVAIGEPYKRRLWVNFDYASNEAARPPVNGRSLRRRAPPTKEQVAQCLASGHETVREMFICSGGMFTPELLSSCILGGSCDYELPAYAFDGFLSSKQESWSQSLTITSPKFEANSAIKCITTKPESDAANCVSSQLYPQPSPEISACGSFQIDPDALSACIVSKLGSPWNSIVPCIMGSMRNNPTACLGAIVPDIAQRMNTINGCVAKSGSQITKETLRCLTVLLPDEYANLGACVLTDDFSSASQKMQCLAGIPQMQQAYLVISCTSSTQSPSALLSTCARAVGRPLSTQVNSCLQSSPLSRCLPGDPLAACVDKYKSNSGALITCLTQTNPELQNVVRVAQCLINASNASDFVAACLPIDEKVRLPISCALQQTDRQALLACAAAAFLSADQRRILSCAMSSQSYLEFAVCYTGIKITREQAVVLKCVGQFGPTPAAAGCAAGQLTVDELDKCREGIGTSDGCFGPNNSVVQAFTQLASATQTAPGIARDTLVASINLAISNVQQTGKAYTDLVNSLDQCSHNPGQCGQVAVDFCKQNPVACATGLPIPGRPNLPPITINISTPQIPAPSCNLQWKCSGWECRNMCD